jgi:hypothetical protein
MDGRGRAEAASALQCSGSAAGEAAVRESRWLGANKTLFTEQAQVGFGLWAMVE